MGIFSDSELTDEFRGKIAKSIRSLNKDTRIDWIMGLIYNINPEISPDELDSIILDLDQYVY